MIYSYVASHVALLPASSRCLFVSVSESSAGPPVRSPSLGADDASRGSGAGPSAAAVPELRGHAPARGLFQCPIRCIICGVAYRSPAGRVVELSPSGRPARAVTVPDIFFAFSWLAEVAPAILGSARPHACALIAFVCWENWLSDMQNDGHLTADTRKN